MNVKVTDILKAIHKLNPAEKHRLREYLIEKLTASSKEIKGRQPRKRGGAAKKRGISKEQVCVLVATDRDKLAILRTLGMGRITKGSLDKAIGHKLSKGNV